MEIICAKCGTDNTQDSEFCKRCGAQIKDKEANPVHSAGETTQISEPKKADGPTQKSKEIYRTLVEQARDGIIVLQGGKINFANSYLTDLSGYSPQELLNSKFIQYIHPDEQEKVTATYTRRMKGENVPSVYESALLHKDGSRVEVEFNAHVTTFDGEPADLVIVRDITERKRLREERNRILNLSPDLICIAGLDGYFKYVNPAWENILGYPKEELCSKPFFDFIHPDDHAKNEAEVEKLASGHQTLDFENRYLHKDGSIRHILWVATPLPEEKLLYCIGRDITERKQAEEKFLQYQKRLKALALQLTLTEEKERRHIAADLHDHIGHSL
ncbi:MAG: PAS domain S-box protein, partial [Candidatus Aminicenantes bacterium]